MTTQIFKNWSRTEPFSAAEYVLALSIFSVLTGRDSTGLLPEHLDAKDAPQALQEIARAYNEIGSSDILQPVFLVIITEYIKELHSKNTDIVGGKDVFDKIEL